MSSTVKLTNNKTQHVERELPCVRCSGKTSHIVKVSVRLEGSEGSPNHSVDWTDDHEIIQCQGCKSLSYRKASTNSEDIDYSESGERYSNVEEVLYPPRIEGRTSIGSGEWYLPVAVRSNYHETLQALLANSPVLTAIGLRALIEAVCKEKEAKGQDLLKKIDDLRANGVLTPGGAEILHRIRTLGNKAAHEVKPHSAQQLALAMDVVEHLLKDVYILPARMKAEFDGDESSLH